MTGSSGNCFRGWLLCCCPQQERDGIRQAQALSGKDPTHSRQGKPAVERKLLYLKSQRTPNVLQWVNSYKLDHTHTHTHIRLQVLLPDSPHEHSDSVHAGKMSIPVLVLQSVLQ